MAVVVNATAFDFLAASTGTDLHRTTPKIVKLNYIILGPYGGISPHLWLRATRRNDMAQYGSDDVVIVFDNSAGTTVNVSQSVLELNGIDVEAILEESHTFGDSWVEQLAVGLNRAADITIKGFYDDDSDTGSNFIFKNIGETRTLAVTWGSTKITSMETIIKNFRRMPTRGELTKYEVVLVPTGAVAEA